jgi:putative ABC transport system permease protein
VNAPVALSPARGGTAREAAQTRAIGPEATTAGGLDLLEAVRSALGALAANKLRAMLTGLGIFIGIAAVIATVSVGAGARQQVLGQIRSLGANLLIIWPGSVNQAGVRLGAGQRPNLTWDDAQEMLAEVPSVVAASANIRQPHQVVAGNANWSTNVQGSDPDLFVVQDWVLEDGRFFTAEEARGARKVAVLGATVAEALFGDESAVGQEIRIRSTPFEVVGVLARKGQSPMGQDQDDVAVIPFWTARRSVMGANRVWARGVSWISLKVEDGADMAEAAEEVRALMRQRHRLAANEPDDFHLRNMSDVAATADASARTLSTLLASAAAVSLLVGGIGVMNIMLVSVTERTREIGLRLAIGARRRDILAQFLIEAVVLALLGGAVGVAAGIGLSHALGRLAGWPTLIQADSVVLAVCVSALTGLFFGYWPARRAARLDPIAALRHD